MDGKRNWLGWIAIGIGTLALLAALFGPGFGRQATGFSNSNAPQSSMQAGPGQTRGGPQGNMNGFGANAQPGQGQPSQGQPDRRSQSGSASPSANMGRGIEQRGGSFGWSGRFHLPFKLISGAFQTAMLALLIVLGLWLLRGRSAGGASASGRTEPAQGPSPSPTGEVYTDE